MKLFNKWDMDNITFQDKSIEQVISLSPIVIPHTFAKHGNKRFAKIKVNIIERFINKFMRGGTGEKVSGRVIRTHGRLQGKKLRLIKIVENALSLIEKRTGKNPLQVFITALENAAPREDITRVQVGGVRYQISVDISATRRVDVALRHMALASLIKSFNNKKPLYECIAEEIIAAANNDAQNSFAVRKKDEIERMAKAAR
jgi:small subunit ribosomal protein S7